MRPRDNPFRVECLEALPYRFLEGEFSGLLDVLAAHRYRGAIIGPHGHGKSTLLAAVAQTLGETGHSIRLLQLTETNTKQQTRLVRDWLKNSRKTDLLFLDGAEQLTWWNWLKVRLVSRSRQGLVITAHQAGLLPTVYECKTSPELLHQLVGQLTQNSTTPAAEEIDSLFQTHHGNIRECLRALYDRAAGESQDVRMRGS